MQFWNPFRRLRLHFEETHTIHGRIEQMARSLDDTLAAVRAESTRIDSLIVLVGGLRDQIKNIGNLTPAQQAAVDSIFDEVARESGAIDMALTTDAAGNPAPAGDANPAGAPPVSDPGGTPVDDGSGPTVQPTSLPAGDSSGDTGQASGG